MEELKNKKVIIFDFDHTIGHLDIDWKKVRNDLHKFYKEKYDVDINFDYTIVGLNNIYKKLGKTAKESCFEIYYKYELNGLKNFKFVEPVKNFIEKNHKNYILVIWSGNFTKTIKTALGDLINCFKLIIGRETIGLLKPETEGFDFIIFTATSAIVILLAAEP